MSFNSVYYGPQTAKKVTGLVTHPTGGDQAGRLNFFFTFNRSVSVPRFVVAK